MLGYLMLMLMLNVTDVGISIDRSHPVSIVLFEVCLYRFVACNKKPSIRFSYCRLLLCPQVTCGYASNALAQFLSTSHTELQLARMKKAIVTGTGQVMSMLSIGR